MPFAFVYVGAVMFVTSLVVIGWVMVINPYAESSVRIQTDRGQKVVTTGPYRFVRHPMYVGIILMGVASPLVWGSVWALAVSGVLSLMFIWRTAHEDRTLRRELPGYEEFAAHTLYRLLPGVW
jgi:protein-S-isoprenylcysteine O-methyltransferase Ste14